MSEKMPRVWGTYRSSGYVEDPAHPKDKVPLDTPAWFRWLEAATTRRFTYPVFDARVGYIVGFMTVRKEGRQRGGSYWTVYRRHGGRVRKVYMGCASRVTSARLAEIAQTFVCEQDACRGEDASRVPSY